MGECWITPFGCVKEIGKCILTQCMWPPFKRHIDYWWCFDNNIQGLRDGIRDLDRETFDVNQKIEEARLRTENLRPGVQEWSNAGSEKLAEARRILADDNIPKAWNLISRYSMGKNAKETAEDIAKLQNDGNFNRISDSAHPPSMESPPCRQIMDFESRKRIEEDIIGCLKNSSVGLIGICGMGGVGKTTMVQRIRKRVMEENLFDEVVMVVVGQQKDMFKIQEEIAELFGLNFNGKNTVSARAQQLRTRLMDTKRKIIIFDDVWESLKLEDLGVPSESEFERFKILLTTRSKDVCEKMEAQKIIAIEILSDEEAWILFKEKTGDCVEDSTLLSVAKYVVAECKGLPIALVTAGKALQNRGKSIWVDSLLQLKGSNPVDFPEVLANVYKPLKLSFYYLDNERERYVFLLCCLFPEDYNIPIEQLTWYCMGLRMFDDIRSIEEARNRTHRLVEKLKSRFLLIDGGENIDVKMHDVVRDVAIYIGSKEKDGFLKSLINTSMDSPNCNWMSVDISNDRMEVPVGLQFPKLRLLMLLNTSHKELYDMFFEGMEALNVLSFLYNSFGSLPPTLGLLKNLRTLYMYCCSVENISVIGELASLEILSCYRCNNIKELPAEVGRLNQLRLLELCFCKRLRAIPFGIISSLVQLEELKIHRSFISWEAEENGERRSAAVTELGSLPNLTCLQIEISDCTSSAQEICLSQNLVKYSINIACPSYPSKERNYQKVMNLNLPSYVGLVGKWIQMQVRNTEYLFLQGDGSNNINLAETENLRNLKVNNCSTLKKLVKSKDCKFGIVFPFLETLRLEALKNLEEIFDGTITINPNVSLNNLKSIEIIKCTKLRYLFSVSMARRCFLQLQVLKIEDCDAMEQVFRNEITGDTDAYSGFPKLKTLTLRNLPNVTAFCQGLESINFPELTEMVIEYLPKLNSLSPHNSEPPHDQTTDFLFSQKVEMGGLKTLSLSSLGDNIRNIWCLQIPFNFFSNLETLEIYYLNGIKSLMSSSIARNLVKLRYLSIGYCQKMVEVIEGDADDGEAIDIKYLFPTLKVLSVFKMLELRRFWRWNHALELPLLQKVSIRDCPVMETFTLGSLSTPNMKMIDLHNHEIDDQKDLNDAIYHIWAKYQDEHEVEDDDEDEKGFDDRKRKEKEEEDRCGT